jgi:hypothetical protein
VKLSVKLLSGLALMALVAVAVIGLSNSASAAVDGKVYVTNVASSLTTESGPPTGRKLATTVYGTYASLATTGTSARDIVTDSDKFIVTVVDSDLNLTTAVTSGGTGYKVTSKFIVDGSQSSNVLNIAGSGFDSPGEQIRVTLTQSFASPIIGAASTVNVLYAGTNKVVTGVVVVGIDYAGGGTAATPPIITLGVTSGAGALHATQAYAGVTTGRVDISYSSSNLDSITASVKSVVDVVGSVVTLTETGRNTGRFEGYVQVLERTAAVTSGASGGLVGSPATIPAIGGPITIAYVDAVTSGSATNTSRTASYKIDVTPPTASISTPVSGSETQNRLPAYAGTLTDTESGLDVSTFKLLVDQTTDAANATNTIAVGERGSVFTITGTAASISTTSWTDGSSSQAWTHTQSAVLPNSGVSNPDHVVDFQVQVSDLAGNFGYSDADTVIGGETTGRHGNQPHTIKVDLANPAFSLAESGIGQDTTVTPAVDKANVRDTIKVTFDGKLKDTSVAASDFSVTFSPVLTGATYVPASVVVTGAVVFLDLDVTIPSDNKPVVKIVGTIEDLAGNSASQVASITSLDKLAPVVTVVRSLGSGTGADAEAADSLTKDKMTVTITSDEALQASPAITVTDITSTLTAVSTVGNVLNSAATISQGSNVYNVVVAKGSSASGARAVKVIAVDSAGNSVTSGSDIVKAYTLDLSVSAPTSVPAAAGTTTQSNPFLTTDYLAGGETASVTITSATLQEAALTAEDVTTQVVASADSKTFFLQPTTALNNAKYTYVVKATDAAGNTLTTTTTFTKSDRKDFVLTLFAGWNAVSVPSDPLVTEIGSVLTNAGVKQVVGYDATTASQPWRIASKVGSGEYSSQTEPALTSVTAGPGYWVETSDFEDQTVALEGPTGPGDAQPGLTTIATGSGWNLVGVVDQSRTLTQKANKDGTLTRPNAAGTGTTNVTVSSYFNTVNNGRSYVFNTVQSQFNELGSADTVTIGSGIWVFISAQQNGNFPPIVP